MGLLVGGRRGAFESASLLFTEDACSILGRANSNLTLAGLSSTVFFAVNNPFRGC